MRKKIICILLILLSVNAIAQNSQAISGVPVLININTMDDYENGKECSYSTILKYTFNKIPSGTVNVNLWSKSDYFDGPSNDLTCKYISYKFEKATINNMSTLLDENGGTIYYYVSGEKELTNQSTNLMNFKFTDYTESSADVYFYFKFYVREPAAGGVGSLKEQNPGYYYLDVNFEITYIE